MGSKHYKNGWLFDTLKDNNLYSSKKKEKENYLLEGYKFLKEEKSIIAAYFFKKAEKEKKAFEIFHNVLYQKKKK